MAQCKDCSGTGETPCQKCDGDGEVDIWDEEGNHLRKTCPDCGGSGRRGKCYPCKGTGVVPD